MSDHHQYSFIGGASVGFETTWMSHAENKEVGPMAQKISLARAQHLLVHKPLVVVRLKHSETDKKVIVKALERLWASPRGAAAFHTLDVFLGDRAPRYDLTPDQMGARAFLLRQMELIRNARHESRPGLFDMFRRFAN